MLVSLKKILIKNFTYNFLNAPINAIVANNLKFGWKAILLCSNGLSFLGTIINFDQKLYFIKEEIINQKDNFHDIAWNIKFYNAQKISTNLFMLGSSDEALINSTINFRQTCYFIKVNFSFIRCERKTLAPITFFLSNTNIFNKINIINVNVTDNSAQMLTLNKISTNWYKSQHGNFFYKVGANFNFVKQLSDNQLYLLQQKINNLIIDIKQMTLSNSDFEAELLIIEQYNINQIIPKIKKVPFHFVWVTC